MHAFHFRLRINFSRVSTSNLNRNTSRVSKRKEIIFYVHEFEEFRVFKFCLV